MTHHTPPARRPLSSVALLVSVLSVLAVPAVSAVQAQDTRTVTEPVRPRACTVIAAQRAAIGDSTVADADESKLDSPRIQTAIDACAAGQAVVLQAAGTKRAFVSGPLRLKAGVTIVIDTNVILFASRDARQYDVTPNACGLLRTESGRGCRPLIMAERANGSGVMGPGVIDGRGWARLVADTVTWWEMAEQARDTKYSQNNPRLIQTSRSNNFTLYKLTLRNGPNFHVVLERGDSITAWGVTINTPKGARNTDGIDPSGSQNVSILHSWIHTGDDNVAIKAGTNGGARNMTVAHSHFYNGHGVSIGSETDGGASRIHVEDVTFQGTDNALRIKSNGSRGGLVDGVTYSDVCIRDVKYPIYMDSHYSASPELDGNNIPQFRNVVVRNTRIMGKGTVVLDGYDAARPLEITFDRVVADVPASIASRGGNAKLTRAGASSNLIIAPNIATITGAAGTPSLTPTLAACETRFKPFPGGAAKPIEVRKLAKPPAPASAKPAGAQTSALTRGITYTNPILFADFSDPDVVRDGDDYWMTASSFGHVPGLPILHSRDLVHWALVNHAIPRFTDTAFNTPQHGNGVWAPSIREHDGWFWIYYGDPDRGIYMTKSRDPRGAWSPPLLVQAGKGLIDPSPLWDDDGNAYLVHAYARSRAGIKHRLVVRGMRPDGTALLDSGTVVLLDSVHHPTAEGPKFYKRDGWYWIFAPAGGVATGWQLALRSRSVRGPYAVRTVLAQRDTKVNGPHQGGWVTTASGEEWFLHFQDRGAYGRIVHLQPMQWRADGWPVIGTASANDTTGAPVSTHAAPRAGAAGLHVATSDMFANGKPGLQWQWQANPRDAWIAPGSKNGLRLVAQPLTGAQRTLWDAANLLLQKFPAESFTATTRITVSQGATGDATGLVVFGLDYAWIGVRRGVSGWELVYSQVADAEHATTDTARTIAAWPSATVEVRVTVTADARCQFAWRTPGAATWNEISTPFTAREGKWVGAKVGMFATQFARRSATPLIATIAPFTVSVP